MSRIIEHVNRLYRENAIYQIELFLPINKRQKINYYVPDEYFLRNYNCDDQSALLKLMHLAGFTDWDLNILRQAMYLCVPDGFFLLIDKNTQKVVAAMMARHLSNSLHPFGGRIDWLAADPHYSGKGLGYIVSAAATNRLIEINYKNIYVTTDDHRLAAIKTFLKVGFVPNLFRDDMYARWEIIFQCLGLPFQPEQWNCLRNEKIDSP